MTLKDRLNENVTWQQIGITIGILSFSASLAISLISSRVDKVDAKVDGIVTSNNKAFVEIAENTSAILRSKLESSFLAVLSPILILTY